MTNADRKAAIRAIMAETGWNYTRALREYSRRYAEARAGTRESSDERDPESQVTRTPGDGQDAETGRGQ